MFVSCYFAGKLLFGIKDSDPVATCLFGNRQFGEFVSGSSVFLWVLSPHPLASSDQNFAVGCGEGGRGGCGQCARVLTTK